MLVSEASKQFKGQRSKKKKMDEERLKEKLAYKKGLKIRNKD